MTEEQLIKTIKNQRLPLDGDFWFDALMGTFWAMGFAAVSSIFLVKLGFSEELPIIPVSIFWIIVIFLKFHRSQKLEFLESDYTKSTNFNKVRECLRDLNWKFSTHQGVIYLGGNSYWLKWLHARIIPTEKGIYYNFQYHSVSQAGRLPFFVGIRTFTQRRFKKQLLATINGKTIST